MAESSTQIGSLRVRKANWNLTSAVLFEEAVRRGEGRVSEGGALVVATGKHTGRAANDKFIVKNAATADRVWWGKVNKPFPQDGFDKVYDKFQKFLADKEVFVLDAFVGTNPEHRIPVRVITQYAWHNLFIRTMLLPARPGEYDNVKDPFTIIDLPEFQMSKDEDGTNGPTGILVDFEKKVTLIASTAYAGEMKKSAFSLMNFVLPQKGTMPMHASANIGPQGDTAVFFGLSGTGKTTLSADSRRTLIGDDEHGWGTGGVFNFEGGCYAKVIRLSPQAEPEIYATTKMFATVLENVVMNPQTRALDFDDASLAENSRACYPISYIPNASKSGMGGQPKNVVMLTYDAFGVLPPIARLSPAQAAYYFLSGYTAKVAGTEIGVKEPQATFSTCFGAPFMPLHPTIYSKLLTKNIGENGTRVWLMNTGFTGGPYGVGKRMSIQHTRALLNAALEGTLDHVRYTTDPIFGFDVPTEAPGVPASVLHPRDTWADKNAYDEKAKHLAKLFIENFKQFADQAAPETVAAGPKVG
ncbi:MAG TPA: phosphoenolpyruvate carboxykinase (ATP) [Myxococcales bacterium]|nr:phosphoenolpyruvate carboxykinase (ATP) [Myxococcales bacterium]